jgi:hypothetical protein
MRGTYVLDLVPPCDGLSRHTACATSLGFPRFTFGVENGCVAKFSFNAQLLMNCTAIIADDLAALAHEPKLPDATQRFGEELGHRAMQYAETHRIDSSLIHLARDRDTVEFHLDVVLSAGRWCQFWAGHGHWLDIDE